MRQFAFPVLALATLAFCSSACIHKPTLELDRARISNVGAQGVRLDLTVRVNNDNDFDFLVQNFRAQVTVEDRFALGEVKQSPNVWVRAGKTSTLLVPVVVPWTQMPAILAATSAHSTVHYQVTGTADISVTRTLAVERKDERIDEVGEIPRQTLVAAGMPR